MVCPFSPLLFVRPVFPLTLSIIAASQRTGKLALIQLQGRGGEGGHLFAVRISRLREALHPCDHAAQSVESLSPNDQTLAAQESAATPTTSSRQGEG